MADTALESTLVIKLHEQMREDFGSVTTITTSGQDESETGVDTTVSVVKPVYFQYKRPYQLRSGEKNIKFKVNREQRNDLVKFAKDFDNPIAFYVFPLVAGPEWAVDTLSKTLFIDAEAIEKGVKYVYVPSDFVERGKIPKDHYDEPLAVWIDGERVSHGAETVPYESVRTWGDFKARLEGCCISRPKETHIPDERSENNRRSDHRYVTIRQPKVDVETTLFGSGSFPR